MKHTLLFLLFCIVSLGSWAIPARRGTITVQQADGSVITLQMVGDEHFHYYRNVATGEAMRLTAAGQYVSIDPAELTAGATMGQQRRAAANARRSQRLVNRTAGPNKVGAFKPTMGQKRGLVILVNFTDKLMASGRQAAINSMFNQEGYTTGGHVGSVHDYFYDQSYGQLDLQFDVVGPVTVSQNMKYYGGNDADGNDLRPATMVIEALKLVDSQVNFANYDWDGDGEVDQVYIIYAGYGENSGAAASTIWPHEWQLSDARSYGDGSGALRLDGVRVDTYACSSELSGTSGSTLNPIGTACHEFSHCLGFPDTYDVDYSGAFGMDAWDVMCSGSYNGPSGAGEVPAGYTAYERWQAGWLTPTELSDPVTVSNMGALHDTSEAYILYNSANRNEYILLENRQPVKWFGYLGEYAAGSGLLATHIDYNSTVWSNNAVNDTPSRQRMTIIPAGKTYGTYSSYNRDWIVSAADYRSMLFPGSKHVSELLSTSHASYAGKWFTNPSALGHDFTEITEANGCISFLFDGGTVIDDGSRWTVTFNPGTGSCSTTALRQSTYREKFTLPVATTPFDDCTFVGWSTTPAEGRKPSVLLAAGTTYQPTADVTLYAVYEQTDDGTMGGSYTLDYNAETALQSKAMGYGKPFDYTAKDGSTWTIKAYNASGLQINKGKSASIKVPNCPDVITSVEVTMSTARTLKFSATDYTGKNTPVVAASASGSTNVALNLSGKDLTTGYIYITDGGSTVISKVVVSYGSPLAYYTYPEGTEAPPLPTYTVTFDAGSGTCDVASLTEPEAEGGVVLPAATTTATGWTFAGWATSAIADAITTCPTLLAAGSIYRPGADATLYAVFTHTEAGQGSGSYTLDYNAESALKSRSMSYGNAYTFTAKDGSEWVIKAYSPSAFAGLQINNGKDASIKVPDCPGSITTIQLTTTVAKVLTFAASDYTGGTAPTAAATSASATSTVIDLTGKDLTTGYVFTTDGATAITKIVVNYSTAVTTYTSYPATPTAPVTIGDLVRLIASPGVTLEAVSDMVRRILGL